MIGLVTGEGELRGLCAEIAGVMRGGKSNCKVGTRWVRQSKFRVLIFSFSFLKSTWPAFSGKKNMEAKQRQIIAPRARTNICFAWVLKLLDLNVDAVINIR